MKDGFPTREDQPEAQVEESLAIEPRTDKDSKFIQMFEASGFDINRRVDIAVAAGFSPRVAAKANAGRIIKSLANNVAMQKALKKKGVDYNKLADKLVELLDCKHPAFPNQADNQSQLKAVELSLRVHDALPSTKLDIDKTERKEIVFTAEVLQRIEKYERLKDVDVEAVTVRPTPD